MTSVKIYVNSDRQSRLMRIGTEAMWADHFADNIYILKSTPLARVNLAFDDEVICRRDDEGLLRFVRRRKASTYSTFRIYPTQVLGLEPSKYEALLDDIQSCGCGVSDLPGVLIACVSVPINIDLRKLVAHASLTLEPYCKVAITANRQI